MRISKSIIEDFIKLQRQLPQIIEGFGIQHKHIYESAGIPKATYFRKLKAGTFDGHELLKIAEVINK